MLLKQNLKQSNYKKTKESIVHEETRMVYKSANIGDRETLNQE